MIIYNKMFAEKILAHVEHTNRFLLMLYKVPGIGENLYQKIVFEDNRKLKDNLGRAAEVFLILLEFLRKYIYVLLFMYVPYRIISVFYAFQPVWQHCQYHNNGYGRQGLSYDKGISYQSLYEFLWKAYI